MGYIVKPSRKALTIAAAVLITALCVLVAATHIFTPPTIWLPAASAYTDDNDILYTLPNHSQSMMTKYGKASVFTTPAGTQYYEFLANPLLDASSCPNIAGPDTLDPSGCRLQGSFHGNNVYEMDRDDASTLSERYVQLDHTFVYIVSNDYGMHGIDKLEPLGHASLKQYLHQTDTITGAILAKQAQAKRAAQQQAANAYTKLLFTPALPSTLPSGWHMLTDIATPPVTLDGPDVLHPLLLSSDYTNGHGLSVRFHAGALSAFHVGTTCGPTPGESMQDLPCTHVSSGYWEAVGHMTHVYVRYLYYPVGNCLVMSEVTAYAYGSQAPAPDPSLLAVQDQLTLGAKPVTTATLKNTAYDKVYF